MSTAREAEKGIFNRWQLRKAEELFKLLGFLSIYNIYITEIQKTNGRLN